MFNYLNSRFFPFFFPLSMTIIACQRKIVFTPSQMYTENSLEPFLYNCASYSSTKIILDCHKRLASCSILNHPSTDSKWSRRHRIGRRLLPLMEGDIGKLLWPVKLNYHTTVSLHHWCTDSVTCKESVTQMKTGNPLVGSRSYTGRRLMAIQTITVRESVRTHVA